MTLDYARGRLVTVDGIAVPVVITRVSEFAGLVSISASDPDTGEEFDVIVDPALDVVRFW